MLSLKAQKKSQPLLETYWESYLAFPYNYSTCYNPEDAADIDPTNYGIDLATWPTDKVNIVNIAFAKADDERYILTSGFRFEKVGLFFLRCRYVGNGCQPFICGLHLFGSEGLGGEERLAKLKEDIAALKAKGTIVKLAFGGEEWGNTVGKQHKV